MRIKGKDKLKLATSMVRIIRTTDDEREETTIRVRPLPIGKNQQLMELFPEPIKPQDWLKDAKGIILRDPETSKPMVGEVETAEWRKANRDSMNARMAYIIYHGIVDPDVELPEGDLNSPSFYTNFFNELVEFGFTLGDLSKLMSAIMALMNISEDVEEVKGN